MCSAKAASSPPVRHVSQQPAMARAPMSTQIQMSIEPWAQQKPANERAVVTTNATIGLANHAPTACTRTPRKATSSPAACSGVVSSATTSSPIQSFGRAMTSWS